MNGFWQGRRVFVTGGTGLVGSWLVKDLLAADADVVVLVRDADPQSELLRSGDIRRVWVVNGSVEDYATLERAINSHEVDTVIHLGAQTIVGVANRSPLQTFESNIRGTYNLLEACRIHRDRVARIVIASSDKAYGEHDDLPYTEDMRLDGRHPYDVSKACTDAISLAYHHSYDLPVAIARCGNIYGGGDLNWSRIVPGTIRSLLRRERPILRSDGRPLRDYIYVKDVVRAYMRLAERLDDASVRGEAFNFSTERPVSVLGMVAEIQRLMGIEDCEADIRDCARGEIRNQYLSSTKAKAVLDWTPSFDLEKGLTETIAWYAGHLTAAT
jgi:CDP-glucose 4,6-dehydratase